jgi:hypothetical protein
LRRIEANGEAQRRNALSLVAPYALHDGAAQRT